MASSFDYWYRGRPFVRAAAGSTGDFSHAYRGRLGQVVFSTASVVTATGSLTLGAITAAGSASVKVPATGSLSLGSIVFAGSAGVAVPATGSLALGSITFSGSSSAVPIDATGSLSLGSISFEGSAGVAVGATGSLVVGSITMMGGESVPIDATGSLDVGSIVFAGSGGRFDAATTQGALQLWWASRPDLQALTSDGKLWHLEAPEGVDLPYVTFFQVAETERDGRTTGYTYLESVIQFSVHAETDEQAATIRKALRAAVLKAPLSIDGEPVWYVLPGDQTLSIGEGFGRHGRDCWIATVDVTIPWQTDAV